jgi:hypothetical protein
MEVENDAHKENNRLKQHAKQLGTKKHTNTKKKEKF